MLLHRPNPFLLASRYRLRGMGMAKADSEFAGKKWSMKLQGKQLERGKKEKIKKRKGGKSIRNASFRVMKFEIFKIMWNQRNAL